MQRALMSRRDFLALPKEEQVLLANELLALLSSDLSTVEQRKAKTNTSPPPID
jgi:hypothetical protein